MVNTISFHVSIYFQRTSALSTLLVKYPPLRIHRAQLRTNYPPLRALPTDFIVFLAKALAHVTLHSLPRALEQSDMAEDIAPSLPPPPLLGSGGASAILLLCCDPAI